MTTKAEQDWMEKASRFCIVCYLQFMVQTPAAIHHLLTKGGRRRGHLFSIGLCDPGHHKYPQKMSKKIARHPTKAMFEKAYGTEDYLLSEQRRIIRDGGVL